MLRFVVLSAALAMWAAPCSGGSSGGTSSTSGSGDGGMASDAGSAGDGDYCHSTGGAYVCGNKAYPVCPTTASEGQACGYDGGECYVCQQGAGILCSCTDGGVVVGGAALQWDCVGTEYPCQ